ncbi:DUF4515 domain-containing protein [Plasmodiophora brassicae]
MAIDAPGDVASSQAEKQTLLGYYRSVADSFDKERLELVKKIDEVDVHRTELQKARLETSKRDEQVAELQRALSDAHLYLFDEREHLLRVTSENAELRAQDVENRKRIQDLLALTRPVAQEVTYFRDEKPKTLSRSLAAPAAKSKPRTAPGTNAAPNVIRTIYMPNSKTVEQLQAAVESLRTRLMQTEKLAEEREKAHREDRRIRIQEAKVARAQDKEMIAHLQAKLEEMSLSSRTALKEHLVMRYNFQKEKRELVEQLCQSRELAEQAQTALLSVQNETEARIRGIKAKESSHCEQVTSQFRKQTMDLEEDLAMVREQYAVTQQLYEGKIAALEDKNAKLLAKYRALERRRALEVQGLRKDAAALREQFRSTSRHVLAMSIAAKRGALDDLDVF